MDVEKRQKTPNKLYKKDNDQTLVTWQPWVLKSFLNTVYLKSTFHIIFAAFFFGAHNTQPFEK